MDIWSTLIAIIGSIGGLEGIRYLLNRKAEKRKADTQADSEEFHLFKEYNEFLQSQLQSKEERFQEQTLLVRKLNAEVIDLTKAKAETELKLAQVRCEELDCPFRKPPTAMTPPPSSLTKDEYFKPN